MQTDRPHFSFPGHLSRVSQQVLARLALAKCANFWGPGEAPSGWVAPGEMSEQDALALTLTSGVWARGDARQFESPEHVCIVLFQTGEPNARLLKVYGNRCAVLEIAAAFKRLLLTRGNTGSP